MSTYNIAIVGATGAVGRVILEILEERQFPVGEVHLLASERSAGETILFNNKNITVKCLDDFDFNEVTFAFFSAGGEVSKKYAPIAADAGAIVIDNTSYFRYEPDIPLVVPEVNAESLRDYRNHNIIANPNCSTAQLVVVLKPIHDDVGISRVNVATYQSVSGAGFSGVSELAKQSAGLLNGEDQRESAENHVFDQPIAFNCLPNIDSFEDNGYTREEMKLYWETMKILGDNQVKVNATAVRVPVFYGHSEAVHIETMQPITVDEVKALLRNAPGVQLVADNDMPTVMTHAVNHDPVFVGRVRADITHPNGINLWIVADNVRKGAALNAVQIAETLIERNFFIDA